MNAPTHIAFIMDGNGRWATARQLPRSSGHAMGEVTLRLVVQQCELAGVRYVTFYAFSTENMQGRAKEERQALFDLVTRFNAYATAEYPPIGRKVRYLGSRKGLPQALLSSMDEVMAATAHCGGLCVNIALNYGATEEITQAVNALLAEGVGQVDFAQIEQKLYTASIPLPDVIVRTGGEKRLSNFMMLQSRYAELFFSEVLWPDFSEEDFQRVLSDYALRVRKFGAT